jgi:putative salt-induced outer membrane protein
MQIPCGRSLRIGFLGVAMLLVSTTVWAQEKGWSDKAEVSFVQTGGNTDVVSFKLKNLLKYNYSEQWSFQWRANVLFAKSNSEKSAERYDTEVRADYALSPHAYFYGQSGWAQDTFAGLDHRFFGGPGFGYVFLPGLRHVIGVELGGQFAKEDYTDGTDSDFMEGRVFCGYAFLFNDAVTFSQEVEYLHNFRTSGQFKVIAVTAIKTRLTDRFALRVAYEIRYDNQPTPEELKKTDTLLSASLVINF